MASSLGAPSLAELETDYLQWLKGHRASWATISKRAALAEGTNAPGWLVICVHRGRMHSWRRARQTQCVHGVEHRPETHPGWITSESSRGFDSEGQDSEPTELERGEVARECPLSLHVGPPVLGWLYGRMLFASLCKVLAFPAFQCMPSHPMHSAYMEQAKDSRDRLARVPRERGIVHEELRGVRFEPPPRRPDCTLSRRVRLSFFCPYTPAERTELYRRLYGADCQVPMTVQQSSLREHVVKGQQTGPALTSFGNYVLFSNRDLAVGQIFNGHGSVNGRITGKAAVGGFWEYRISGFRKPRHESEARKSVGSRDSR